ncbi:2-amino-4-hydroxy-6-hydroxymethyldihydropteridine diphosphokinase [Peptoniphilus ovalis]
MKRKTTSLNTDGSNMDFIKVKDLEVYANHGLFEEEKKLGQKFLISAEIGLNFRDCAISHDLDKSIDYGKLSHELKEVFTEKTEDLIETLVYKLVKHIFDNYEIAKTVEVEIKKPWAPINLPLDTASVRLFKKKRHFYIGMGTNMGNREEYLEKALEEMEKAGLKILDKSSVIETKAWGVEDQADFLNRVVKVESFEDPIDVLHILQKIEIDLDRVRIKKWGPRTIDLDVLFVDREIIYTDELIVPHPFIEEREFVLESLNELIPTYYHPILNKKISKLYEEVKK